jgi:Protein of unknown function (DUF1360)
MTTQSALTERLAGSARKTAERYSGGTDLPLRGYLMTLAAYSGLVTALTALARLTGRQAPARVDPGDLLLTAVATFKLSRLITKDPITSPLRAPFSSYEGTAGPAELSESPRGLGERNSIGELVTCPFCAEVWIGTGLTAGLVFVPRLTRLVMGTFTALAGADFLQFAHAWLMKKAD